jgi:hypothetical protein
MIMATEATTTGQGVVFRFKWCGASELLHSVHSVIVSEQISGEFQPKCVATTLDGARLEKGEWLYGSYSKGRCPMLTSGQTDQISPHGGGWGIQRFIISDGQVKFLDVPCQ